MSIQLMLIAAYLPKEVVTQPQKLALMKIADSADDESRIARPGMLRLARWVGVGKKRSITIVTQLVEKGLVERVEVGRPGRAAVYKVFPLAVPSLPTTDELRADEVEAETAPKNPNLARKGVRRAKPAAPARTWADVAEREAQRGGLPRGNPEGSGDLVPPGEPDGFPAGNSTGSPGGTPSFLSPTSVPPNPPTPTADAAGESAGPGQDQAQGCARHKKTAKNCRACGTSARAQRERREEEQREAARLANQAWVEGFVQEGQQRRERAQENGPQVQAAREEAMRTAREARSRHHPS